MLSFAHPAKLLVLGFKVVEEVVDLLSAVTLFAVFRDEPSADLVLVGIKAVYVLCAPSQRGNTASIASVLLLFAFSVKPLSVRSSPCSVYSNSLATLLADGSRGRKLATPSNVPDGK